MLHKLFIDHKKQIDLRKEMSFTHKKHQFKKKVLNYSLMMLLTDFLTPLY